MAQAVPASEAVTLSLLAGGCVRVERVDTGAIQAGRAVGASAGGNARNGRNGGDHLTWVVVAAAVAVAATSIT